MARKRVGRYRGFTEHCSIVHVENGPHIDAWCTYHAQYVCECIHCNRLFHSDRPHTKYCSTACQQKAYRVRKNYVPEL